MNKIMKYFVKVLFAIALCLSVMPFSSLAAEVDSTYIETVPNVGPNTRGDTFFYESFDVASTQPVNGTFQPNSESGTLLYSLSGANLNDGGWYNRDTLRLYGIVNQGDTVTIASSGTISNKASHNREAGYGSMVTFVYADGSEITESYSTEMLTSGGGSCKQTIFVPEGVKTVKIYCDANTLPDIPNHGWICTAVSIQLEVQTAGNVQSSDKRTYIITTTTGNDRTDDDVYINIYGINGRNTGRIELDASGNDFESGDTNRFTITGDDVGNVAYAEIYYESSGDTWSCTGITVDGMVMNASQTIFVNGDTVRFTAIESATHPSIRKVVVKNVKANGKKSLAVEWKELKNVDGYQVAYATKRNGKYRTKQTTKLKYTLTKLKEKKKYYVKVRAYRLDCNDKEFGEYSKVFIKKTK